MNNGGSDCNNALDTLARSLALASQKVKQNATSNKIESCTSLRTMNLSTREFNVVSSASSAVSLFLKAFFLADGVWVLEGIELGKQAVPSLQILKNKTQERSFIRHDAKMEKE